MKAIQTCLFAALAACGGGDAKPDALIKIPDAAIDAAPDAFEKVYDFSCLGNAAPTTATAMLTIGGTVSEVVVNGVTPGIQAAHSSTVDVCKGTSTTCTNTDKLDTKMTPAMGCPAMGCPYTSDMLATNSMPFDIYVKTSKTADRTTFIYPPSPVTMSIANLPAVMFSNAALQALGLVGITQDPGKAIILLAVTDCANQPITEDITLSIKQGGTPIAGANEVDLGQFAAQLAGTKAIFNVPAGTAMNPFAATEVGAVYTKSNKTLRAHVVTVFADATTATIVRPGF
jgi:hypothetical protein